MGSTLERVRETFIRGEIQLDPMETPKPHDQNHPEEANTIIISDSMLKGVAKFIQKRKVELHIQRGATTNQIHESLGGLLKGKHPQVVVVHCGTNNIETASLKDTQMSYQHIINDILFYTEGTKILISGIIHRLDKPYLNPRIDSLNGYLQGLQTETVSFIDYNPSFLKLPNILNNGGLHMRNAGTRQVAVT